MLLLKQPFLFPGIWQKHLQPCVPGEEISVEPKSSMVIDAKKGTRFLIHSTNNFINMETVIATAEGGRKLKTKKVKAYGTTAAEKPLDQLDIQRRIPTPHDVQIDILFCGVCHSDLHTARNEWHITTYPVVPGHEIVGKVVSVGDAVTKFKVGDIAAVGCMVDSCRECQYCKEDLEQYCEQGSIQTYNSPDQHLG